MNRPANPRVPAPHGAKDTVRLHVGTLEWLVGAWSG